MSVCPSVRMNSEISETIRARLLGLGMHISELLAQRKLLNWLYFSYQYLSIDPKKSLPSIPIDWPKKKFATNTLTPITLKSVYRRSSIPIDWPKKSLPRLAIPIDWPKKSLPRPSIPIDWSKKKFATPNTYRLIQKKICHAHWRPQTAQTCDAHNFHITLKSIYRQ